MILHINEEREIPGQQKVVRGSNARGSESPFETCFIAGRQSTSGDGERKFAEPLSLTASLAALRAGYIYSGNEGVSLSYHEPERRVIKDKQKNNNKSGGKISEKENN